MISQVLSFICVELRPHLGLESHAVRPSSRPAVATGPKHATATLVGVRESPALRQPQMPPHRDPTAATTPALELDVLLSFGGSDYGESLDLLAKTIDFLHAHPTSSADAQSAASAPALPPTLDKLTLHAVDLSREDQHHLWSALSAPYVPSVVYRVTLVPLGQQ